MTRDCRNRADRFFAEVAAWLAKQEGGNGRVRQPKIVANALSEGLDALAAAIRRDAKKITKPEERQDLVAAANRLDGLALGIEQWRCQELDEAVYWIEAAAGRQRRRIELLAAPLHVGPILRAELFAKVPSVIMTSATLAAAGAIRFLSIAGRPVANRARCAWAAPSTTSGRRNWSCPRTCPTRRANRRATKRRWWR